MDAALVADGVNRHNEVMMQLSGGLGFILEALKLLWIQSCREWQNLESHAAIEGDLMGFINDAHDSPADLADQSVIA